MLVKFLIGALGAGAALAASGAVAWTVSPWPSAFLFRTIMNHAGSGVAAAMEKHVPAGVVTTLRDQRYDSNDPDARYDVHRPSAIIGSDRALLTIVWIHGGGWISGSKELIAPYARILASHGYTVVVPNYSLAPAARYPVPVRQVNTALGHLAANAARLNIDPNRLVLAGDSAGAQIAAQIAALISVPGYGQQMALTPSIARKQLAAMLLFCGAYDAKLIKTGGPLVFAQFVRSVGWSYLGEPDFLNSPEAGQFSVIDHVTADFPPAFISAGNGDPLLAQSLAFADALAGRGVHVDRLFFTGHRPRLPHEYQFNLDADAGQTALKRVLAFLAGL